MSLSCFSMQRLMERRRSGLSSAEGLTLEDHLASCTACRAQANLLNGLTQLASQQPASLDAAARTRAISAALAAETPRSVLSLQPPRPGFVLLGAAVAVLALALGVRRALAPVPETAVDRVLSGEVQLAGSSHGAGERVSESAELYSPRGAALALGHAQVELRSDTGARWDARTRTLALQQGSVLVEVDPAKHASFSVQTEAFVVAVLGTRFEVTPSAVHVLRGRVTVTPRTSDAAAGPIVLAAGTPRSDFELQPKAADAPPSAATSEADTQPASGSAQPASGSALPASDSALPASGSARPASDSTLPALGSTLPASGSARPASDSALPALGSALPASGSARPASDSALPALGSALPASGSAQPSARDERSVSSLLGQARSQLAARELAGARHTLKLLPTQVRDSALRAQALSLEAECNLLEHKFNAARDIYLRVARLFPQLPAAETALFAAARVEAEHGLATRARELFGRYLERYPNGSFAREAQHRLELLRAEPAR